MIIVFRRRRQRASANDRWGCSAGTGTLQRARFTPVRVPIAAHPSFSLRSSRYIGHHSTAIIIMTLSSIFIINAKPLSLGAFALKYRLQLNLLKITTFGCMLVFYDNQINTGKKKMWTYDSPIKVYSKDIMHRT